MNDVNRDRARRADIARHVHRISGTPYEAGLALGRAVAPRLSGTIERYIHTGPAQIGPIDYAALRAAAQPWLDALPGRYRREIEGIAAGAGLPASRIAEWHLAESFARPGCTTVACRIQGRAGPRLWIARNNDLWAPGVWGYVTIRDIEGRIPTISFGLEGEPFTATGINQARLWLHYHYLPIDPAPLAHSSREVPSRGSHPLPDYVLLTEALETCHSLAEVEALLMSTLHEGGMMLFGVDGRTDEVAVWECGPTTCRRRPMRPGAQWIAGTNHSCIDPPGDDESTAASRQRLAHLERLTRTHCHDPADVVKGLVSILADPGIEGRDPDRGTVYANVACPSQTILWYTFGGYPAASAGHWAPLPWPW